MMTKRITGGCHSVTAAVTNILEAQGVTAPHTGKPFTEAMLLGIGGGLGAGYILFEFKWAESAIIVLGFRNRWHKPVDFLSNLCGRLGIDLTIQETAGRKGAADNLRALLDAGQPCLAWVDKAHMPYQALPEALKGFASHVVGVHGADGDNVLVDDLAADLFRVPFDDLVPARGKIPSDKNRLGVLRTVGEIDLKAAVLAGVHDCVEHLGSGSESFALPVYEKWSKLMIHPKNKKGWPVVFKERKGLYSTLRSIYEGVLHDDTESYGLREMYAEFLEDAAHILENPMLTRAAEKYHEAAHAWNDLAEAALPAEVGVFRKTKALMTERYDLYWQQQPDAIRPISAELETMRLELDRAFPMTAGDVDALFDTLHYLLNAVYAVESEALALLREALQLPAPIPEIR